MLITLMQYRELRDERCERKMKEIWKIGQKSPISNPSNKNSGENRE